MPPRLAYRDRYRRTLEGLIFDPSFDSETPPLVFPSGGDFMLVCYEWNEDTFTKLLSALQNGLDLTYPDEADNLLWQFLKGVNAPMDLCQLIANCLTDPESPAYAALIGEITDQIDEQRPPSGGSGGNTEHAIESILEEKVIDHAEDCDNDHLFGAVRGIVEFMNASITDLYQKIEAATNTTEVLAITISAIPAIGASPADETLVLADQLEENVAEAYLAGYDETVHDTICCDIFCLLKDSCEWDWQAVCDYFAGKCGQTFTPQTQFIQAVAFMEGAIYLDPEIVTWASMYFFSLAVVYGSSWLGVDANLLTRIVASKWNDPDSDWETLCEECPECITWDFEENSHGFANTFSLGGAWESGTGWKLTFVDYCTCWISKTISIDHISGFSLRGYMANPRGGAARNVRFYDSENNEIADYGYASPDSGLIEIDETGLDINNVAKIALLWGTNANSEECVGSFLSLFSYCP